MAESTIKDVQDIMDRVSGQEVPMTGEEAAYQASKLTGYLYRLRLLEVRADLACNARLMEILRDAEFWNTLGMKASKTTAESQLKTEAVWRKFLELQSLRIGAEETVRSLRSQVKLYESERREFT